MKFQKPYIIETEHYIQIYYGGACNPSKLQNQKRKKITSFTRQSQRRLMEKIESVSNYKSNYIMKVYFNCDVSIIKSSLILASFFVSMKKYFEKVVGKIPMVFWRKCFSKNSFWYECLLDIPETTKISSLLYISNMYWRIKVGKNGKIDLQYFNINDKVSVLNNFCFENCKSPDNVEVGRYWGMFYKKYHKFKKIQKKIYSSLAIKEKIKNLKPVQHGNIKRYIFEKPNESSKESDSN